MLREIVSPPPPLLKPAVLPLFSASHHPCLTPLYFAGWLVAPYRPSVQPLQPLALHQHHQHPQPTPTQLPGPIPSLPVPDSTTTTTYSNNKMASLDLSPTDSPNVTLTIRLIMQGKVSSSLPLPSLKSSPPPLANSQFFSSKSRALATVEHIQRERERCRRKSLLKVKMQFAQLSLSSSHYFPKLHLAPPRQ